MIIAIKIVSSKSHGREGKKDIVPGVYRAIYGNTHTYMPYTDFFIQAFFSRRERERLCEFMLHVWKSEDNIQQPGPFCHWSSRDQLQAGQRVLLPTEPS